MEETLRTTILQSVLRRGRLADMLRLHLLWFFLVAVLKVFLGSVCAVYLSKSAILNHSCEALDFYFPALRAWQATTSSPTILSVPLA